MYFQFFVLGNIVSRYRSSFEQLLDNNFFTSSIILLFFISFLVKQCEVSDLSGVFPPIVSKLIQSIICSQICRYCGLLIVFAFFRKYQASFTSTTKLGASLQYIGRRTLDIYLLHYFFIPTLPAIGNLFRETPNTVLELVCGVSISLIIVGVCLLTSNIIRISDLLGHYLFGAKIPPKQ